MQSRDNDPPPLTGFGTWTANDYSNFVTICVVAVGSTLLVVFKSCCVKISLCFGLWSCDREVQDGSEYKPPRLRIQTAPAAQGTLELILGTHRSTSEITLQHDLRFVIRLPASCGRCPMPANLVLRSFVLV
jgi:hypothetical protein